MTKFFVFRYKGYDHDYYDAYVGEGHASLLPYALDLTAEEQMLLLRSGQFKLLPVVTEAEVRSEIEKLITKEKNTKARLERDEKKREQAKEKRKRERELKKLEQLKEKYEK